MNSSKSAHQFYTLTNHRIGDCSTRKGKLLNAPDIYIEKILWFTTVNRLYITPLGDVLVCPYVHIKIGNVYEQSLREIVDYGFSIKHFRNHSDLCLAGEDTNFVHNFMKKDKQSIFNPSNAKDIFPTSDFVN